MPDSPNALRLLAVEDNPADRSWLELMLRDATVCPHQVRMVTSLRDAEAALAEADYDCVLLDLSLPDATGVEGIVRLRDRDPGLPIVVFTGTNDQEVGLASIEAGAQDYLVKGQASGNTVLRAALWATTRQSLAGGAAARRRGGGGSPGAIVAGRTSAGPWDAVPADEGERPPGAGVLAGLRAPWVVVDADLRVTELGPGLDRVLGPDHDVIVGAPVLALFAEGAVTGAVRAIEHARRTRSSESLLRTVQVRRADGSAVSRALVALPLEGADAGLLLVLAAAPSISSSSAPPSGGR